MQNIPLMNFGESEQIGLFTFYMQQKQLEEQAQTQSRHKKAKATFTHKKTKSYNDRPTAKQWLTLNDSNTQNKNQHKNRMTEQYNKQKSKSRRNNLLTKMTSEMKSSPKKIKIKGKNDNKFPLNLEHLSPSAKLKAHLDYLTTQQNLPEPSIEQIESRPSDIFRPQLYHRKFEKPILKGVNLNDNVAQTLDIIEQRKTECPKKMKMKTRYSFKHPLKKEDFTKTIYRPLPQLLSAKQNKNISKMLALSMKNKKVESQKWKNPVKQQQESYLDPIITDRKYNYPVSVNIMKQIQTFCVPELRKSPTTLSIDKQKNSNNNKQYFKLQNSHLLKTINI